MRFARMLLIAVAVGGGVSAMAPGSPMVADDLTQVFGGDCQDCKADHVACVVPNGPTCTRNGMGQFTKRTGTLVTKVYCFQVATGAPGLTDCKDDTPKDCIKELTCTDNKCANCAAGKNFPVNTNCLVTGYYCTH